jgi:hypothetical protein
MIAGPTRAYYDSHSALDIWVILRWFASVRNADVAVHVARRAGGNRYFTAGKEFAFERTVQTERALLQEHLNVSFRDIQNYRGSHR